MHTETTEKIHDDAQSSGHHARGVARTILLEAIMDLPTSGGIDDQAYWDALMETDR